MSLNISDVLYNPKKFQLNIFLPCLATAMLACWSEAAARQLQKTYSLNTKGYNLSCTFFFFGRAHVFKFRKQMKNWIVISITMILSLLGGYFLTDLVTLLKRLFWNHMDTKRYVLSYFLSCTQFICWKIIRPALGLCARSWLPSAVAAVIICAKCSQTFRKHASFS